MTVTLSLFAGAGAQFLDNNGNPLSGGKIYTYQAGTTTPLTTYTTNSGTIAHTNPIVLDAAGRVPSGGEIWLTLGIGYKFVVKTSAEVLIATYDNIPSSAQPPAANDADFIMYEQGYTVTAGSFVIGKMYRIATLGTTDFTLIGAINNVIGTHFIATGVGTGTGTAELSQTVESKLRETVSVEDFGAVGDGVTDDAPAIRAAYESGASVINFGQGKTYYINSFDPRPGAGNSGFEYFQVNRSNVHFVGNGCTLKLGTNSNNARYVVFYNTVVADIENISFSNFIFDGNAANNINTTPFSILRTRAFIQLNYASNVLISGCTFKNADSIICISGGIYTVSKPNPGDSSTDFIVDNCNFLEVAQDTATSGKDHTTIFMSSKRAKITNCNFNLTQTAYSATSSGTFANAIEFHGSDITATNNTVNGYFRAFIVPAGTYTTVDNIRIANNSFKTHSFCGLIVITKNDATISNVFITDNYFNCNPLPVYNATTFAGNVVGAIVLQWPTINGSGVTETTNPLMKNIVFKDNEVLLLNAFTAATTKCIFVDANNLTDFTVSGNSVFSPSNAAMLLQILNTRVTGKTYNNISVCDNDMYFDVVNSTANEVFVISDGLAGAVVDGVAVNNNRLKSSNAYAYAARVFVNSANVNLRNMNLEGFKYLNSVPTVGDFSIPNNCVSSTRKQKLSITYYDVPLTVPSIAAGAWGAASLDPSGHWTSTFDTVAARFDVVRFTNTASGYVLTPSAVKSSGVAGAPYLTCYNQSVSSLPGFTQNVNVKVSIEH